MAKLKEYSPIFGFFLILIAISYWGLGGTFYQQDEWQEIGLLASNVISLNPFNGHSLIQLLLGQGRYFSDLILAFFLTVFPFNNAPLAYASLCLHFLNTVLVFWLTERLAKNRIVAIVAASFFAVAAVGHQAIIWGAAIATLVATSFILLSVLSYLQFIERKKRRWLYWSLASLFASLLFKEIGIFLIIFLPLLWFVFDKEHSWRKTISANWVLISYGAVIILFRVSQILFGGVKNGQIIAGTASAKATILFHLILYPITGLFQTLLPSELVYKFARYQIDPIQYRFLVDSPLAEIAAQTVVTDLLAVMGTALLVLLVFLVLRKEPDNRRTAIIAFSFAALSFLPYAVLDRGGSYMDSRYYYIAAVGIGIVIGLICQWLFARRWLGAALATLLLVALLPTHIVTNQREVAAQVAVAKQRRVILQEIKAAVPNLEEQSVFYLTGNQEFYIADNMVPFQQGMGYTLMVWYKDHGPVPLALLGDKYLWDQGSEGYREVDGVGFGFFNHFELLKKTVVEAAIPPTAIHAFYWDNDRQILQHISDDVRAELSVAGSSTVQLQ